MSFMDILASIKSRAARMTSRKLSVRVAEPVPKTATISYPPLSEVTKLLLTDEEVMYYVGLDRMAISQWSMGKGPFRPTTEKTADGKVWLRWKTADVRNHLGL